MMLKIYLKMLLKRVCNRNNYRRSTRTLSLFFCASRGFKFCARGFMGSNMAIWEQGIFLPKILLV
jgi:hypothetical protein